MWLRRLFFRWLLPAAFVLPLWIFIGWAVFGQSAVGLLWVLLMAMPTVFAGQLVLTLLTRSRPSVRAERMVSWWDVLGFGVWHILTISVGLFLDGAFGWLLAAAIIVALGLFWLQLWQLWSEARGAGVRLRESVSWSIRENEDPAPRTAQAEFIVLEERRGRD